jgi:hypothetical protein
MLQVSAMGPIRIGGGAQECVGRKPTLETGRRGVRQRVPPRKHSQQMKGVGKAEGLVGRRKEAMERLGCRE